VFDIFFQSSRSQLGLAKASLQHHTPHSSTDQGQDFRSASCHIYIIFLFCHISSLLHTVNKNVQNHWNIYRCTCYRVMCVWLVMYVGG